MVTETVVEQAAVLSMTPAQHALWVTETVDPRVVTATATRLGHLLAIDLAAQACLGPGSERAANAVHRQGTAPNGIDVVIPLLTRDTATLVAVRLAVEHRAGGAHILSIG